MRLCLGAQINKQDISKPQQETADSRGLFKEHELSLEEAEGPARGCPVGIGSQITAVLCTEPRQNELASDQNWNLSTFLFSRPAGPLGSLLCHQSLG